MGLICTFWDQIDRSNDLYIADRDQNSSCIFLFVQIVEIRATRAKSIEEI